MRAFSTLASNLRSRTLDEIGEMGPEICMVFHGRRKVPESDAGATPDFETVCAHVRRRLPSRCLNWFTN